MSDSERELRELVAKIPHHPFPAGPGDAPHDCLHCDFLEVLNRSGQEQPPLLCPICHKPLSSGISWCKTCEFTHAVSAVECSPCGYISEAPCELGKRAVQPAVLTAEQIRTVLANHWLSNVICHHAISPDDENWDRVECACSAVNLPRKATVGEAVGTWIEHVLKAALAAQQKAL